MENCTTSTLRKRDILVSSAFLLFFFFSAYSNCFFLFLWNKDSLKQSKKKKLFFIPTPIKIIFIYLSFYSFYSSAVPHSHSFSKTRLSDSHRPLLTHLSTSFIPLPFHHRRLDSSSFLPIFEAQLRSSIIHHPHRRPHAPSPTRFLILLTHLPSPAPFIHHPHPSSLLNKPSPTHAPSPSCYRPKPHRRAFSTLQVLSLSFSLFLNLHFGLCLCCC